MIDVCRNNANAVVLYEECHKKFNFTQDKLSQEQLEDPDLNVTNSTSDLSQALGVYGRVNKTFYN